MADSIPMWWMRGRTSIPQEPPCPPQKQPFLLPKELTGLAERLQHPDAETLLLLALLWLLYQERADKKLLLALAYIAL